MAVYSQKKLIHAGHHGNTVQQARGLNVQRNKLDRSLVAASTNGRSNKI